MTFPEDANGDVLRRLISQGDDLTRARDIDFVVVFDDRDSADKFATHFRGLGLNVSVEMAGTVEGLPWDVKVVNYMIPTYEGITDFEDQLERVADPLGGRNDGWGCISQTSAESTPNS